MLAGSKGVTKPTVSSIGGGGDGVDDESDDSGNAQTIRAAVNAMRGDNTEPRPTRVWHAQSADGSNTIDPTTPAVPEEESILSVALAAEPRLAAAATQLFYNYDFNSGRRFNAEVRALCSYSVGSCSFSQFLFVIMVLQPVRVRDNGIEKVG
jgi:hypothetical protein